MNNRTRIKFCGMTRAEDIAQAVQLGVDAVGLILVPGSPRQISIEQAAVLRRGIPALVTAVALLRNPDGAQVREIIAIVRPQLLQFHGEEPADFCESFGLPYVKAIALKDATQSLDEMVAPYRSASALLLDGHARGGLGGQGESFDWNRLQEFSHSRLMSPIMLAGGLTPSNVIEAILTARPYAVEVSSGIEAAPGRKDSGKMRAFVHGVHCADAEIPDGSIP